MCTKQGSAVECFRQLVERVIAMETSRGSHLASQTTGYSVFVVVALDGLNELLPESLMLLLYSQHVVLGSRLVLSMQLLAVEPGVVLRLLSRALHDPEVQVSRGFYNLVWMACCRLCHWLDLREQSSHLYPFRLISFRVRIVATLPKFFDRMRTVFLQLPAEGTVRVCV